MKQTKNTDKWPGEKRNVRTRRACCRAAHPNSSRHCLVCRAHMRAKFMVRSEAAKRGAATRAHNWYLRNSLRLTADERWAAQPRAPRSPIITRSASK
jgi:hypothetical protein